MNEEHIIWSEKYRPMTIADCILPKHIKEIFQEFAKKKEIPNLFLPGLSGVGKTTVAKALCEEVGCDYLMINGSEETGIDVLRTKIRNYASSVSLRGGRKVIIIDEADYMNANSLQPGLRGAIEEFASNCSFVFTCNFKNRIIDAIQGRCSTIEFTIPKKEKIELASQFLERIEFILKNEKVTYNKKVLVPLITKYFPNFRQTINELQKYSVLGVIDEGILVNVLDVELNDLISLLKEKQFNKVYTWIKNNTDNDPARFYRRIYDALSSKILPESIPPLVLVLGQYQRDHSFVADVELHLLACMTEIMRDVEFK